MDNPETSKNPTKDIVIDYKELRPNYCFTKAKQLKFVKLLWDKFIDNDNHNFSIAAQEVSKEIGINVRTFWLQHATNETFNQALSIVKRAKVFQIEGNMFEFAQQKSQFMDRIALARAYIPERYSPRPQVNINIAQGDIELRR